MRTWDATLCYAKVGYKTNKSHIKTIPDKNILSKKKRKIQP